MSCECPAASEDHYHTPTGRAVPRVSSVLGSPPPVPAVWRAMKIGTWVHQYIAGVLTGTFPDDYETLDENEMLEAQFACAAFMRWLPNIEGRMRLGVECTVASDELLVGGTLDLLIDLGSGPEVIDFKTGENHIPKYGFQGAAYSMLAEEKLGLPNGAVEKVTMIYLPKDGSPAFGKPITELREKREVFMRKVAQFYREKNERKQRYQEAALV